eukprot:3679387-Amphidinium_carterae.2
MQTIWEVATPEYLTGEPEDVESIRFLGMEIETCRKSHDLIVHQQPIYVVETLDKICPKDLISLSAGELFLETHKGLPLLVKPRPSQTRLFLWLSLHETKCFLGCVQTCQFSFLRT